MDAMHFDHWIRTLSTISSRRQVVRALILGAITARFTTGEATAGPGCKNVGKKCKKTKECCSGICKGKKGKKTCKAHDTGGCKAGQNVVGCGGPANVPCTTSAGVEAECFTTTGNAGYCAGTATCFSCQRDADCIALCGPQAACITCTACLSNGGTACAGTSPISCTIPPP